MTTDCSLNYKFNTWKFKAQTWGEYVVYRNCFWHSEQFLYIPCSPPSCAKRRASDKDLPVQTIGENQHDIKDVNCSAINGGWSEFENWQTCDETCHKKRARSCTNPSPAYGGENCTGDDYETQFCTDKGGLHLI